MLTRFRTLRNVALSALAVGIAGSVAGIGSGTFSAFNATVSNTGNTFTSASITIQGGSPLFNSSGSTCTATAGATASGCPTVATLATLVPGDSKFGELQFQNQSSTGHSVTLTLSTSESGSSATGLTGTAPGAAGNSTAATNGGLGLLIFQCYLIASNADAAASGCNTSSGMGLKVLYGTCGSAHGTTSGTPTITGLTLPLATSDFSATSVTDNGIAVGTGTVECYSPNATIQSLTTSAPASILNSSVTSQSAATSLPTTAGSNTESLLVVVWLPQNNGSSSQQNQSSNLTFNWLATDTTTGSSH